MDNKLKRKKKKQLVSSSLETRRKMNRENIYRYAKCLLCLIYAIKSTRSCVRTFVSEIAIGNRNSVMCTRNRSKYSICVPIWKKRCTFFYWTEKKNAWFEGKLSHNKKMFLGLCMQTLEIGGSLKHFIWHFFMTLIFFYCRA